MLLTHVITQPCINAKEAACVAVCPVDCIHPTPDELAFKHVEMLYINPETCINCGLCVDECPTRAIYPTDELPPKFAHFTVLNADYYKRFSSS